MALSASRANMFVEHSMLFEFCNDGKINNPFTARCSGVVLLFKATECNESKKGKCAKQNITEQHLHITPCLRPF